MKVYVQYVYIYIYDYINHWIPWIGFRENLQETVVFSMKSRAFRSTFAREKQSNESWVFLLVLRSCINSPLEISNTDSYISQTP